MAEKRVLVTGATGFIGRQILAPLVRRGFTVHAVSSRSAHGGDLGVTHHVCDLLDTSASERLLRELRATHLVHLAWYAEPGRFWTSELNLRWLGASLALFNAFATHGGQRAVVAGSCAEYDWRHGYCVEALTPSAPRTLYGASKHALQIALEAYAAQVGLSLAWGRIFFLYGPHEASGRLVSSVIDALLRGGAALCTNGQQVRDFQHVADTAGAFAALLDSGVTGVVNVASGQPCRVAELAEAIADRLEARSALRLGALATRPDEPPLLLADVRRLRNEVGWTDRYDLESGLDQTIAWWRAQPMGGRS
jgi:nucleoside-diphosphate-sugar epimerase